MFKIAKQKIENTKIQQDPFPFLFVRNLISNKDLKDLIKFFLTTMQLLTMKFSIRVNQNLKKLFYQNQRIIKN